MARGIFFVWQYEYRKKWANYSDEEHKLLNDAVKNNQTSVSFLKKNKTLNVDVNNMFQKNQKTRYEQRVRCLIHSNLGVQEELCMWLWKDNITEDLNCFKPDIAYQLEVAFHTGEKIFKFFDSCDYEVNFETLEQVNKSDMETNQIKRESVSDSSVKFSDEVIKIMIESLESLNEISDKENPIRKRIKLNSDLISQINSTTDSSAMEITEMNSGVENGRTVLVDEECPERKNFHIFCSENTVFSATLNQTNLQNNNNKFYIIQLLEDNKKKLYAVWRRWGRVGQRGQTDFTKYGSSFPEAKTSFEKKFYDKTRNHWDDVSSFVHVPGKYDLLHMELDLNVTTNNDVTTKKKTTVASKLVESVQRLLELICDKSSMEDTMKEMAYDSKKAPLGKLTFKQIQEGYDSLNKIAKILSAGTKGSTKLLNACNVFYTKIPHNFGMKTPPIISTQNAIDDKIKMLEALANINVAIRMMNSESDTEEHPLDKNYHSLNCALEKVCPTSLIYKELEKTLKGTHGPTHTLYEMEIMDAFACNKAKDSFPNEASGEKLLLWHGSRVTNWVGILKQGLCIAPPEAPVQGYMFGKGIYFADVSSKSANYCYATKRKNEGILLMCEVFVGKQYPLYEADENMPSHLPAEYNSVLGKGRICPSEFKNSPLSSDAKVACGPLIENNPFDGTLHYNEYIVYDVRQVRMKYLLRIKFNFK